MKKKKCRTPIGFDRNRSSASTAIMGNTGKMMRAKVYSPHPKPPMIETPPPQQDSREELEAAATVGKKGSSSSHTRTSESQTGARILEQLTIMESSTSSLRKKKGGNHRSHRKSLNGPTEPPPEELVVRHGMQECISMIPEPSQDQASPSKGNNIRDNGRDGSNNGDNPLFNFDLVPTMTKDTTWNQREIPNNVADDDNGTIGATFNPGPGPFAGDDGSKRSSTSRSIHKAAKTTEQPTQHSKHGRSDASGKKKKDRSVHERSAHDFTKQHKSTIHHGRKERSTHGHDFTKQNSKHNTLKKNKSINSDTLAALSKLEITGTESTAFSSDCTSYDTNDSVSMANSSSHKLHQKASYCMVFESILSVFEK